MKVKYLPTNDMAIIHQGEKWMALNSKGEPLHTTPDMFIQIDKYTAIVAELQSRMKKGKVQK